MSLNHVTISTRSGYNAAGLNATDIVGLFSVINSIFVSPHGNNILVSYKLCNRPSQLLFRNNEVRSESGGDELSLAINCSNVEIAITDCNFENDNLVGKKPSIVFEGNSVLVKNSTFRGAEIAVFTCSNSCDDNNLHCTDHFMKLTGVTLYSHAYFDIGYNSSPVKNCTVLIEDSIIFSDLSSSIDYQFTFLDYDSGKSINDTVSFTMSHLLAIVLMVLSHICLMWQFCL